MDSLVIHGRWLGSVSLFVLRRFLVIFMKDNIFLDNFFFTHVCRRCSTTVNVADLWYISHKCGLVVNRNTNNCFTKRGSLPEQRNGLLEVLNKRKSTTIIIWGLFSPPKLPIQLLLSICPSRQNKRLYSS